MESVEWWKLLGIVAAAGFLLAFVRSNWRDGLREERDESSTHIPYQPTRGDPALPPRDEMDTAPRTLFGVPLTPEEIERYERNALEERMLRKSIAEYSMTERKPQALSEEPKSRRRKPVDIFDYRNPRPVRLLYVDARDEETEREVDVACYVAPQSESLDASPTRFRGYCHTRKAIREFAIRRVEEAFDLDTGEEIEDLAVWLLSKPARRRPRDLDA